MELATEKLCGFCIASITDEMICTCRMRGSTDTLDAARRTIAETEDVGEYFYLNLTIGCSDFLP